jgi:hypothetical protein
VMTDWVEASAGAGVVMTDWVETGLPVESHAGSGKQPCFIGYELSRNV